MKRRIHIDLLLDNETTADKITQILDQKIATLDVFDVPSQQKTYGMMANVFRGLLNRTRFNSPADADILRDYVKDMWTTGALANKIFAGSRIALHTCSHDEVNVQPCVEDDIVVK